MSKLFFFSPSSLLIKDFWVFIWLTNSLRCTQGTLPHINRCLTHILILHTLTFEISLWMKEKSHDHIVFYTLQIFVFLILYLALTLAWHHLDGWVFAKIKSIMLFTTSVYRMFALEEERVGVHVFDICCPGLSRSSSNNHDFYAGSILPAFSDNYQFVCYLSLLSGDLCHAP